jgi:hypothetical protein
MEVFPRSMLIPVQPHNGAVFEVLVVVEELTLQSVPLELFAVRNACPSDADRDEHLCHRGWALPAGYRVDLPLERSVSPASHAMPSIRHMPALAVCARLWE